MNLWNRFCDWLAGRERLMWTLVTPKKPGWYWAEMHSGRVDIVKVIRHEGGLVLQGSLLHLWESDVNWWLGPVPMPESRLSNQKKEK